MFNSGKWEITCKKAYADGNVTLNVGESYLVKDKFPGGETNTLEDGIWEIKDGHGGLVDMDKAARDEYFE